MSVRSNCRRLRATSSANQSTPKLSRSHEIAESEEGLRAHLGYFLGLLNGFSDYYRNADVEIKRKLLGLILDKKLVFDGDKYRTMPFVPALKMVLERNGRKRKGPTDSQTDQSYVAPLTGQLSNHLVTDGGDLEELTRAVPQRATMANESPRAQASVWKSPRS